MLAPSPDPALDPLAYFASLNYTWGNLAAIRYDRENLAVFGDPTTHSYLADLYLRTKYSGRAKLGTLPQTFCGMANLGMEAIIKYFSEHPPIVLGEWRSVRKFVPLGYCFLAQLIPAQPPVSNPDLPVSAAFCGYNFFQAAWGSPKQLVLSYLGLAYLFQEFHLEAIHAQRYHDNVLSARWLKKFGFGDCGTIPSLILRQDTRRLGDCVVSTLSRTEFSSKLRAALIEAAKPE